MFLNAGVDMIFTQHMGIMPILSDVFKPYGGTVTKEEVINVDGNEVTKILRVYFPGSNQVGQFSGRYMNRVSNLKF